MIRAAEAGLFFVTGVLVGAALATLIVFALALARYRYLTRVRPRGFGVRVP